jgi:hypothetical protein
MQYRASLLASGYFGHLALGLGALCLATLLISGEYLAAVVLACLAAGVLLRVRARTMVISAETFRYDGWVRSFEVPLSTVVRVAPAHSFEYPVDRIHGGQHCIFLADGTKHWVSLLLFAGPAAREFHKQLVSRKGEAL